MKALILLTLIFSAHAMAADDKCFKAAKNAALEFVKSEGEITNMDEFNDVYDSEQVDVYLQSGWQKEYWSFYNHSAIVNVEVDSVKSKCFVKKVEVVQNDQDQD
ncbi:hypothetical protein C0V70_15540 [Bacteriovorax stolpii]|uniref:Uncharacterized protein n=1 Tax=Bacteriovorax stolpii TaxID=960 RepID=A0A2K9NVF0_BACTC|nr:hypothetical protein [Bacteriovorax stolpii]AUN99492.1 hypothetical protein C0V70_15540 [Bacteriovorax stolpii]TDP51119.1 hypothetical protein C8D79_3289 [Bacteriovorax stolpii]